MLLEYKGIDQGYVLGDCEKPVKILQQSVCKAIDVFNNTL